MEENGQKDFVITMPNSEECSYAFSTGIQLGPSRESIIRRNALISPTSTLSNQSPKLDNSQETDQDTPPLSSMVEDESEDEETQDYKESAHLDKWTTRLIIFEWVVLVCCIGFMVASLTIDPLESQVIWGLELWKCSVLVLVFFCSELFTRWMINILIFLMSSKFVRQFVRREKVLYFVCGVWKSVWLCMWVLLVLITWVFLFDVPRVKRSEKTTRIGNSIRSFLCSSLLGTFIWLGKSVCVKILASKFQGKRFFRRIRAAILNQHIIEVLSSHNLPHANTNPLIVKWISESWGMKKASAWTINGFIRVTNGSKLIVEDEYIVADAYTNKAASQIFKNLIHQKSMNPKTKKHITDSDKITRDDLLSCFDHDKEFEHVLQKQFKNEEITESDFDYWLKKVYNQRNALVRTLTDSKTAIEELERLANLIVLVVILIIWLFQMRILTLEHLVLITSELLLLTFIFGNTLKTVFEAIIFVFVVHPFDVNDYCVIDGEQFFVEEMNLNTTIFLKDDKEKIYYPNSVLATKPISNFYRSDKNIVDSIEFTVDASTNANQIRTLRKDIKEYIRSKNDHYSNPSLVVKDFDDVNKIKLGVYFTHTINFKGYVKKRERRSKVVLKLKEILESNQIKFHFL